MTLLISQAVRWERDIRHTCSFLGIDIWVKQVDGNHFTAGPVRNVDPDNTQTICELLSRFAYVTEVIKPGVVDIRCPL